MRQAKPEQPVLGKERSRHGQGYLECSNRGVSCFRCLCRRGRRPDLGIGSIVGLPSVFTLPDDSQKFVEFRIDPQNNSTQMTFLGPALQSVFRIRAKAQRIAADKSQRPAKNNKHSSNFKRE